MSAETHELRLKIDASAAQAGSKNFTAAVNAVKAAVRDLDKQADGTFSKLAKQKPQFDVSPIRSATTEVQRLGKATTSTATATDRAAENIRKMAIQSANALRVSTDQASRLRDRLLSVGDTAGLAKLEAGLDRLRMQLTNATSGLDVREARAGYADLASQLNRTAREAERVRAVAISEARAQEQASRAAEDHAAQMDRLKAKYNPLYASSKQYELALEEIATAEREGALTAQLASAAREREAARLSQLSGVVDTTTAAMKRNASATMQGVGVGYQMFDVLVSAQMGWQSVSMIALQQGSQLAGQLSMLKATGGSVFKTLLAGVSSLVSPMSLLVIAGTALAAVLAKAFFSAGDDVKSFSDALGDANTNISDLRAATDALAGNNLKQLRSEYGRVNSELDAHLERLRKIAELNAALANADMIASIRDTLTHDGNPFTGTVDEVRRAFDTTNDRARILLGLMDDVSNAKTFESQATAVTALRAAVESTTGGLDKAEGGARGVLIQLVQAEDAALKLKAASEGSGNAASTAAGQASTLSYNIGTAADEAARLLANLNGVPGALSLMGKSVSEQIAGIQAQNKALGLQISEGLSGAAANRRVQLQDMVSTASERGQTLNVDQIAAEWKQIEALDAAAKEQETLRKRLADANRPAKKASGGGGGGSRKAQLSDEAKALEQVNDSLLSRLAGLEKERIALAATATGMFQNTEVAQMFADASEAMGGNVDAATMAMLNQIDAGIALNETLTELARNPAREFMASLPSWRQAGNDIEENVIGGIETAFHDLITGDFSWDKLGDHLLSGIADSIAPLATGEFLSALGLQDAATVEKIGTGTTTEAQLSTGGVQAGQSISSAMIAAGNTVATQLQTAMTSAGSQAGMTQQQAITMGGTMAGAQQRAASIQGGQTLANGVRQGAQMGAPILAQGVAQGSQAGGGFFQSLFGGGSSGGGGGILSSVLGIALGAFSEGGMSTSPVGFASVTPSAFRHAPHFSQGTTNTSGIPAVLHPNEAVIPLSKGRKIPVEMGDGGMGGGTVIDARQTFHIQTPNADSFRKSQKQILSDAHSASARAARANG